MIQLIETLVLIGGLTVSFQDDTKNRILEAAGAVFADKGYNAATVREICTRASANLAAVNYHFGDKRRLYVEAIRRAHQSRVEQAPLPQWPPGTSPQRKLADFIRTLLSRMLVEDGVSWHTQLMLREIAHPDSACEELVADYIRPQFDVLQRILGEMLPSDVGQERRHLIAFSIVGQCLHYRVAGKVVRMLVPREEYEGYTPERLAVHITALTLAALGLEPAICDASAMEAAS